jgi:hypothetical protein
MVGKPEGKRSIRRTRRRWADNIKIDLKEIEWHGVNYIHLIDGRDQLRDHMNVVMSLRVS